MPQHIAHEVARARVVPIWMQRCLLLASAVLIVGLTIAMYAPSLHGPYLLDDVGNLEPVKSWLDGRLNWHWVVFENRSGPTGRPLSMVTFLFDAWRSQSMNSFTFKTTNLAIHLACGLLAFALIKQLLSVTSGEKKMRHAWIALIVATFWLWLPIQVSTVAYVIQRMAQLSALWILATVTAYVAIRQRLAESPSRVAVVGLWVGIPLLAIAALFSKENGAVALPLLAVVEWTIFRNWSRKNSIKEFLLLAIGLPALIVAAFLVWHTDYFSSGYSVRDFTLGQRLLTEPRILWSYLGTSFVPVGPTMGIYHDNYPLSSSLWSPITTIAAILAWVLLIGWAIAWRRNAPLFSLGVIGYLVAHAVESGPIALELYFEHRNYLPSLFALIGALGLVLYVAQRHTFTAGFQHLSSASLGLLIAIYGAGTWNHASSWSDANDFYTLQYSYNPTSPRLLSILTARSMLAKDLPNALATIDAGERASPASERATSTLWRLLAYCETDAAEIPNSLYIELESRAAGRITNYSMTAWDLLADRVQASCPSLDTKRVTTSGMYWVEHTPQDAGQQAVWRTRYNLSRILASSGDLVDAEAIAYRAWIDSNRNSGVGSLLFQLSSSVGNVDHCREVLASLERSYGTGNADIDAAVDAFRKAMPNLDSGKRI